LEFQGRGVTQQNISKSIVEKLEIPLPPLEEQRRIAAILDKADGVRRKRKEAIRLTEELLKSTFLEMFGDPVTNPKGWEIAKLGDFGKILTGNTPPRSVSENYGDEIEWIKSDNITTPEHFLTEAEEKLSAKGKKIARTVPNGSVLVTCIAGSRSSIGRAALTDREVAFNQQINAVVPNSDVDPYFLYGQLFVAQHLVQAQSTDSMKGMVNKSKFSSIEFIKPPSQKQQKFGKWFLGFHRYYMNLISGEEQSENLFNSLLQRAFRGEL
jgi:type I restriction enzyme S subunit